MAEVKARKNKRGYDVVAATGVARAFYLRCYPELQQLIADARASKPVFDIPAAIVLATNLTFACETYLKTALYMNNRKTPDSHNLKKIYSEFNDHLKNEFSKNYALLISKLPEEIGVRLLAIQTVEPGGKFDDVDIAKIEEKERRAKVLPSFLGIVGDSYTSWRYSHQYHLGRVNQFEFHYYYLCIVCCMADEYIRFRIRNDDKLDVNLAILHPDDRFPMQPKNFQ